MSQLAASPPDDTRLSGRGLFITRAGWVILTLVVLALNVGSSAQLMSQ